MKKNIFTKVLSIALVCVMLVISMGAYSGEDVFDNNRNQYVETDIKNIFIKDNITYALDDGQFYPVGSLSIDMLDENAVQDVYNDARISSSVKESLEQKVLEAKNEMINPIIVIYGYDLLPKTRSWTSEGPIDYNGTRMKSEWMTYTALSKNIKQIAYGNTTIRDAINITSIAFNTADSILNLSSNVLGIFGDFLQLVGNAMDDYVESTEGSVEFTIDFDVVEKHTHVETYYGSGIWEYKLLTNRILIKKVNMYQKYMNNITKETDAEHIVLRPNKMVTSDSFDNPYEKCKYIGNFTYSEHISIDINDKSYIMV